MELQAKAISALTSLYDSHDSGSSDIISPNIIIEHDAFDDCPIDLASWSSSLSSMPDLDVDVLEAAADESQRKVWVRSSVSGLPDGQSKQSVDVMTFDSEGMLVSLLGEWRSLKHADEDYESEMED